MFSIAVPHSLDSLLSLLHIERQPLLSLCILCLVLDLEVWWNPLLLILNRYHSQFGPYTRLHRTQFHCQCVVVAASSVQAESSCLQQEFGFL